MTYYITKKKYNVDISKRLSNVMVEYSIITYRKNAIVCKGSTITGTQDSVYENAIDDI